MIRLAVTLCVLATCAVGQQATTASGGVLRVLDKISGNVQDLEMLNGEVRTFGLLTIELQECRYPTNNPSGDAFQLLRVEYRDAEEPVFEGWMIASAPAISAMQHPRYDVWALRCSTS